MKKFSKVLKNNQINLYKQAVDLIKAGMEKKGDVVYDNPELIEDNTTLTMPKYPTVDTNGITSEEKQPLTFSDMKDTALHSIFTPLMLMGLNGTGRVTPEEWKQMAVSGMKSKRDLLRTTGLRKIPWVAAKNYTPWNNAKRLGGRAFHNAFMIPWVLNQPQSTMYNIRRIQDPNTTLPEKVAVGGMEAMNDIALVTELGKLGADWGLFGMRAAPWAYRAASLNPLLFGGMVLTDFADAWANHIKGQTANWNNYLATANAIDNGYLGDLAAIRAAQPEDTEAPSPDVNPAIAKGKMQNLSPAVIFNAEKMEQIRNNEMPNPIQQGVEYRFTPYPDMDGPQYSVIPVTTSKDVSDNAGVMGLVGDSVMRNGSAWYHTLGTFQPAILNKIRKDNDVTPSEHIRRTWSTGTNPSPWVARHNRNYLDYLNFMAPDATHNHPETVNPDGTKTRYEMLNHNDQNVYIEDKYGARFLTQGEHYGLPQPALTLEDLDSLTPEQLEELQQEHPDKKMLYDPDYIRSYYAPITWGFLTNEARIGQLNTPQQNVWPLFGWLGNQWFRPVNRYVFMPPNPFNDVISQTPDFGFGAPGVSVRKDGTSLIRNEPGGEVIRTMPGGNWMRDGYQIL